MNKEYKGKEYATKDISNMVGIAAPTVRKYSQALEKAGYPFMKNENGFRIYFEDDIFVLNEMKNISNQSKGMPVERIAEMIVFKHREKQRVVTSDTPEIIQLSSENTSNIVQSDSQYNEWMNKLSKLDMLDDIAKELQEQKRFNQQLLEHMKEQQNYIKESLERRDRELLNALTESMEQRKAVIEQVASTQQETKKGFFSRLFRK